MTLDMQMIAFLDRSSQLSPWKRRCCNDEKRTFCHSGLVPESRRFMSWGNSGIPARSLSLRMQGAGMTIATQPRKGRGSRGERIKPAPVDADRVMGVMRHA